MFFKRFLSLFLLLILPTLAMQRMHDPLERMLPNLQRSLLRPQLQKSDHLVLRGTNTPWNCKTFKYDDILTFLNDLESGELEKQCSDGDLEQINQFVADLAREGHIPSFGGDTQELEQDIEELLGISDPYAFRYAPPERSSYELTPALYYGDHEVLHCGWFKKAWKKTKKFCKKHKKAIIIGAVVVVVATTVIVVAVAASSSAATGGAAAAAGGAEGGGAVGAGGGAAAVAGAAAASSSKNSDDQPSTTPGINDAIASRPDPTPPAPPQSPKPKSPPPTVEEMVQKHCDNFKAAIAEERPAIDLARPSEPLPFEEAARIHGANAAQSACRDIAEATAPQVAQQPSFIEREMRSAAGAFGLVDQKVGIVTDDGKVVEIPGAQMASGVALPVPNPATAAAVAGGGYVAYEVGKDPSLQQAISGSLEYAKDKVLNGVEYARDRAVEAAGAVVSWAKGEFSSPEANDAFENREWGAEPEYTLPEPDVESGKRHDRNGRSRTGRSLEKKGGRDGTAYTKPRGTPEEISEQGQNVLEGIVNDPGAVRRGNRFKGVDIKDSSGKIARFDADGKFDTFLEPEA